MACWTIDLGQFANRRTFTVTRICITAIIIVIHECSSVAMANNSAIVMVVAIIE